ncbi:hypothetical protein DFH11DRAFT_1204326 [Phellopilus nigrolimitatus]|nr:hypothetical protein DFH11DRAFT_1204326 [Phellopilus nigrolimitatus]
MVSLTPRFLFLAALCAAAAMPSLAPSADARAVHTNAHHNESSTVSHSATPTSVKGKGKATSVPVLPLPVSVGGTEPNHDEKHKKHKDGKSRKSGKRAVPATDDDTWGPFVALGSAELGDGRGLSYRDTQNSIYARDPEHHRHHPHRDHRHDRQGESSKVKGHHDRRNEEAQARFSLGKRRHNRHHHHHDKEVESEKRVVSRIYGKQSLKRDMQDGEGETDSWDPLDPILQIGSFSIGDGRNGNFSNTHHLLSGILKRDPHHHDHHHDHQEVVVAGDDDDMHVHVHERRNDPDTYGSLRARKDHMKKRSDDDNSIPGVPGTVDIMNVGPVPSQNQRLASLVLSSVPDNSTANSPFPSNATKATSDPDKSPFVLDASNSTQTQFFLVVSQPAGAPVVANGTLMDTLSGLKDAASSPEDSDIKVTLQVPVFEPSEAAMRAYCATFDPNPPAPAPLTMERCFADTETSDNSSDPSIHKSQTFAYNPTSGSVRPMWFINAASGTTGSNSSNSSSSSTSGLDEKQMNFAVHESVKDAPLPSVNLPQAMNGTASVNGTASMNGTASVNGTASSPNGGSGNPQNVTLVFTPAGPAVYAVQNSSDVASFEPLGTNGTNAASNGSAGSDSREEDAPATADTESDGTVSATSSSAIASSTDSDISEENVSGTAAATSDGATAYPTDISSSSDTMSSSATGDATTTDGSSATPTDVTTAVPTESAEQADVEPATSSTSATSDATNLMNASATSSTDPYATVTSSSTSDGSSAATPTVEADAIEKMYQQQQSVLC